MIKLLLRIPLIALIVFPYAAVGLLFKGKLLAMALTALVLYVYPFIASRFLAPKVLLFWALTAKIVSIPVFVIAFFIPLVASVWLIPVAIMAGIFDYMLVLSTSLCTFAGAKKALKLNLVPAGTFILCVICLALFCVDIVGAAVLLANVIKNERMRKTNV